MKFLCITLLLCIVAVANGVKFIDCGKCKGVSIVNCLYVVILKGSKDCKVLSVEVSGCAADATTCNLVRGQTVNMTMNFTTSVSTSCCLSHNVKQLLFYRRASRRFKEFSFRKCRWHLDTF